MRPPLAKRSRRRPCKGAGGRTHKDSPGGSGWRRWGAQLLIVGASLLGRARKAFASIDEDAMAQRRAERKLLASSAASRVHCPAGRSSWSIFYHVLGIVFSIFVQVEVAGAKPR